jgi:uncharacterized protein
MPPLPFCANCNGQTIEWVVIKGAGTVFSFTVCHRSPFPDVPDFTYVPALVEFQEAPGVRFAGNIVGVDSDTVRINMPVEVDWHPTSDGWAVPVFMPKLALPRSD